MTENELRQMYVNKMLSWKGKKEADGSHKSIIDIYNNDKPLPASYKVKYTDSWCATTVSAAAIEIGIKDIVPKECSCGRMIALFQKMGRWEERDDYTPKIGDIIFFNWKDIGIGDNKSWPDHVGVIASIEGDTIVSIEGNKNDSVDTRTLKVNSKYIRGYGLPDFTSKAATMGNVTPIKPPPTPTPVTPTNNFVGRLCKINVSNTLNIRTESNTLSKVKGVLKKDSKVTPLKIENGMAYFEGWCSTTYLK